MEKVREIKKSKLPHTTTVNDNDWSFIKDQLEIIRNKVQFFSHEDGNEDDELPGERGSERGSEGAGGRGIEIESQNQTNKLIFKAVRTLHSLAQKLSVLPHDDISPTESDQDSNDGPRTISGMDMSRFFIAFFLSFFLSFFLLDCEKLKENLQFNFIKHNFSNIN